MLMNNCPIKGFQGTSLLDYPGRIAALIFTGGCNFRCRFCHNVDLISSRSLPDLDFDSVMASLKKRAGFIEGVVVTGGEPTIHPGLIDMLRAIKAAGLDVKLDTNGSHPEILSWIIEEKLAEYIAMDYKAPLENLSDTIGVTGAEKRVSESARLIISSKTRHEFRTTVHPLLHSLDSIETIAEEISGARAYFLQQFHTFGSLDPELTKTAPHPAEFFQTAAARLSPRFSAFGVRNIAGFDQNPAVHSPIMANTTTHINAQPARH